MKEKYILGGYTKRLNKGIHEVTFNPEKGKIETSSLIFQMDNPTYVCLNADHSVLFSLIQDKNQAGVIALEKVDGQWREIDRSYGNEINGCHIIYRNKSNTLYVSNYHQGCIDVYQFLERKLSLLQSIRIKEGKAQPYQPVAKMHYVNFKEEDNLVYACNLGQDQILTFEADAAGRLSKISEFPTQSKMGPRHFVFHPQLPLMYVIGEYTNAVSTLKISPEGKLSEINTVDCLPAKIATGATGAAIKISKDGRYLFTSSRFSNFITVFKVEEDGRIERQQYLDSIGQIPRDFTLDEEETHLLVPHQESDFISVFCWNRQEGRLAYHNNESEQPESVCIVPYHDSTEAQ